MQEKIKITWIVMWMTALGQAGMALYLPALPAIALSLHVDPAAVKSTITVFLLGYGGSQLLYGPLSDRYGRKFILLIGIGIFCLGCFINMFAHTLSFFMYSRLLQGLGIGSTITLGRSILRDRFSGKDLASAASYLSMGFAIGVGATPLIGAYLQSFFGWQADFAFLFLAGITFGIVVWKWLPETAPVSTSNSNLPQFFLGTLTIYGSIIRNKNVLCFLFGGLFAYAVVIAYNVMTPFLIQDVLKFSANTYGWLAVLVAIPYYLAASMNRTLVLERGSSFVFGLGVILIVAGGLLMLLLGLLLPISLWIIFVPVMIATFGQALVFPNAISGALESTQYPAGKASAMFSSLQLLLCGVLSFFMAVLPENNQNSLACVLIVLGILSGWILWWKIFKE